MDIEQLKLLATHIRGFLQHRNHTVGHNQALDLVAALPGLRNWPEVQAFPDRVAKCELDQASTGRLAFRLKKRFSVELAPQDLLTSLATNGAGVASALPHIWPTGPAPGVYITTSDTAISALLDAYEDATDGEVVYAESSGYHASTIDLGEYGLWSPGLERLPSGTLLFVGPIDLHQQSWKDASERIGMSCLRAEECGHRIAILLRTPNPDTLPQDVKLLASEFTGNSRLGDSALRGHITVDGKLVADNLFSRPWPQLPQADTVETAPILPLNIFNPLADTLKDIRAGIFAVGAAKIEEFAAMPLVVDILSMTDHLGPAARIMPRSRSTPAKDWLVPDAIHALPYLPSVQSAYEQGYRRIIYNASYTYEEVLLDYSKDALLISTSFGTTGVTEVFMDGLRLAAKLEEHELLERIIGLATIIQINGKQGPEIATDLYLNSGELATKSRNYSELFDFLLANRFHIWEEDVSRLLDHRRITLAALGEAFPRNKQPTEFLAGRKKHGKPKHKD